MRSHFSLDVHQPRLNGLLLLLVIGVFGACRKDKGSEPPPTETCERTIDISQNSSGAQRAAHVYNKLGELVSIGSGDNASNVEYRNIVRGSGFYVLRPAPGRLGVDSIAFDSQNRIVAHRDYSGSLEDRGGWRQRTYVYDANGNLVKEYATQSPEAGTDSLYEAVYTWQSGNLVRQTIAGVGVSARVTEYEYDSLNAGAELHPGALLLFVKTGAALLKTRNRVVKARVIYDNNSWQTNLYSYTTSAENKLVEMSLVDSANASNAAVVRLGSPCR